jgi:hypothetical protein
MSLRDYFAANALVLLSTSKTPLTMGPDPGNDNARIAVVAYAIADAMIAERDK